MGIFEKKEIFLQVKAGTSENLETQINSASLRNMSAVHKKQVTELLKVAIVVIEGAK